MNAHDTACTNADGTNANAWTDRHRDRDEARAVALRQQRCGGAAIQHNMFGAGAARRRFVQRATVVLCRGAALAYPKQGGDLLSGQSTDDQQICCARQHPDLIVSIRP